ncbi:MAG TPA: glycerol-3-phosphate 1-O-acyltransferase PlsY [Vicinamibacterales bacterium]|jgi:acyl phosphate:glycerol-3-phosphate acyltransferase|nr:glycerol-3-phosphate 1-O-acyltransferase PlsY [Vicinamibacterales bacterium]
MNAVLAVTLGYLVGSIPFAYLLSRHQGIDLRHAGSGNVGASNVLRTTGVRAAVLAMVLDGLKGTLAVVIAQLLSVGLVATVAAAFAAVVGHVYPIWLRFRGGKGVATAAGAFALIAPEALGIAAGVFVIAVVATRFISVGSIAGALTLVVVAATTDVPGVVAIGATASTLIIVYRHRGNLARLIAGTERRIGQRVLDRVQP